LHFEGFELEVLKDYVEIWRPILVNRRKVKIASSRKGDKTASKAKVDKVVSSVQGDKTGSFDQAGKTDSRTAASEQEEDLAASSENKTGEGEEYDYGIPEDDKVLEIEIANSFNHTIQQRYINHIYYRSFF
jgi:hypothetical protein